MPIQASSENITSISDFPKTTAGAQDRWSREIKAALKQFGPFHKQAEKVMEKYRDDNGGQEAADAEKVNSSLNLFWSNTQTLQSILYARLPKVDVSRKFSDPNDDVARVATLMMDRLLNFDIQENGKEYDSVLKNCVQDRLLPGLGCARVYYDCDMTKNTVDPILDPETGKELAKGYDEEVVSDEWATLQYFHWRDVIWGWTRGWPNLPWIAFRNYLTKDESKERFDDEEDGTKVSEKLKYKNQKIFSTDDKLDDNTHKSIWQKAEIWEIWDIESKCVWFWSDGMEEILDQVEDPLELKGFFPLPPPMLANITTTWLMPKPDFAMAQDLYNEIDVLDARISKLTEGCKLVGLYDKASIGIKRLFDEAVENELIPVDNWAMFAEKGGIQGQIDWLPLKEVAETIQILESQKDRKILMLEKITGMSDIITGAPVSDREPNATTADRAEFGSVRIQSLQEDLARFATDLLELKAEVIAKHCSDETILAMSNAKFMEEADQGFIPDALKLIHEWNTSVMRISIKSESMAMVDYTKMKAERTEFIQALGMILQSMTALVEQVPDSLPYLVELMKWGLAGFKSSDEIEGVLDRAIDGLKKNGVPKKDDGQAAATQLEQAKMQAQMQLETLKGANKQKEIMAKMQSDLQVINATLQAKIKEIVTDAQKGQSEEQAQAVFANAQAAMAHRFQTAEDELTHTYKMEEIKEAGDAQIRASKESGGDV